MTKDGREISGEETDTWPDGFSELDGGDIHDLGDGQVKYLINYDNAYHIQYRMRQRGDIARDVVTEKFVLGMRIMMLGFEHALRARLSGEADASLSEASDEMRRILARAAASTVLAIAENLPKIIDASSVRGDADDVE